MTEHVASMQESLLNISMCDVVTGQDHQGAELRAVQSGHGAVTDHPAGERHHPDRGDSLVLIFNPLCYLVLTSHVWSSDFPSTHTQTQPSVL